MSRAKLVVVGSSNIDMVVKAERIPCPGETLLGNEFAMVPGGKGANQAVCAAKLGADVKFVARVGDDVFGETSLANFHRVGVNTEFVIKDTDHPSGVALIVVDIAGENAIVVAPGANHALTPADVDRAAEAIRVADVVLLQLEIPSETVTHTIDLARALGVRVVLNPAPIRPISRETLAKVDVLVPNQHEAAYLVGAPSGLELEAELAARKLIELGARAVVITLGSNGAYVADESGGHFVEAYKVTAVDTTAAGDAFTASLACGIAEGMSLIDAARFATKVAALSVTRLGAQSSMPSRDEVDRLGGI
ncbi:MAG: ribokinase [Armatimonadetes bacterium]|nr:ribokinase [Armatimonadota bacterium]